MVLWYWYYDINIIILIFTAVFQWSQDNELFLFVAHHTLCALFLGGIWCPLSSKNKSVNLYFFCPVVSNSLFTKHICWHLLLLCPVWSKPFPISRRLYRETAPLSVPRRKNQYVLGDQVTPAVFSLCENQGWLPSTREQNFKSLLISFSLFDPHFLKVRKNITFNKMYWMMQMVSWNAVSTQYCQKLQAFVPLAAFSLCTTLSLFWFLFGRKIPKVQNCRGRNVSIKAHTYIKLRFPNIKEAQRFWKP